MACDLVLTEAVVWFVPDAERPWRVSAEGKVYTCRAVVVMQGATEFRDSGFCDLPGGPRGVLSAHGVTLNDPLLLESRAAT